MKKIDRRQPRTNPQVQPLSEGVGRANSDVFSSQRFTSQQLSGRDWQVYEGSVVMAIPQLGWHVVALEGQGGLIHAQVAGQNDVWGTQVARAVQNGTSVLVARQTSSRKALILGEIHDKVIDPGQEFLQQSFAGSWTGLERDPPSKQFYELTAKDSHICAYSQNILWDQHAGDWSVRTNLGVLMLVDNLGIRLAADEVTSIVVDLPEQLVGIEGRKISIMSDGFALHNSELGEFSVFAMGRSGFFGTAPNKDITLKDKKPEDPATRGSYRDTLGEWLIEPDEGTYYGFGYAWQSIIADGICQQTTHLGPTAISTAPTGCNLLSGLFTGIISEAPVQYLYREPGSLYDFEKTAFERTLRGAVRSSNALDGNVAILPATLRSVPLLAEHLVVDAQVNTTLDVCQAFDIVLGASWVGKTAEGEDKPKYPEGQLVDLARNHESFVLLPYASTTPPYYAKPHHVDHPLLGHVRVDKDTNTIEIVNEQGSGIRICGSTITVDAFQIRLNATRDIVAIGRDVQILANRNVTVSSNKNLRIYSEQNVAILSGNSGKGGTLLENRAIGSSQILPDDPEDAQYSGISLKATKSQVSLLGGGVLVKAGDSQSNVSGDVVLLADSGNLYMSSSGSFTQHNPNGIVQAFGSRKEQVTQANVFGPYVSTLCGQLQTTGVWADGDIVAKSSIQAINGSVASVSGGQLGRVTGEGRSQANAGFQQMQQQIASGRQSASQAYSTLKEQYGGETMILNSKVFGELSTAYKSPDGQKNVYGATTLSTTYQHEFQPQTPELPLVDFVFPTVVYRPDSSRGVTTRGWPGENSKVLFARKSGELSLGKLVKDWSQGVSTNLGEAAEAAVTPAQLFKTLSEE